MDNRNFSNLSRRDFLKLSAATAASACLPTITGCSTLPACKKPPLDYQKLIKLENCNLIDVKKGTVIPKAAIFIRNGKIEFAGQGAPNANEKAEIFDMENRYVMPGLINGHVHMTLPGTPGFNVFHTAAFFSQMKQSFIREIESGVTTVRDMGSIPGLLKHYTDDVENGVMPGPRVVHSTPFINPEGGYPDVTPSSVSVFSKLSSLLFGTLSMEYKGLVDLKARMDDFSKNASYIKLSLDDKSLICGGGKLDIYKDKDLSYIFDYADKKGLPVSCHNLMNSGFKRILNYPVFSLEHIVSDAAITDDDAITMADKNIKIIPTCILGNIYLMEEAFDTLPSEYRTDEIENELRIRKAYWDSITDEECEPYIHQSNLDAVKLIKKLTFREIYERKHFIVNPHIGFKGVTYGKANLHKLKEAGVLIGCGTDSGVPMNYHGTLWRELEIMSRGGFKNDEILRCATVNNAKICRMEDKIGSLEKDMFADIVVLEENPLENIEACRAPLSVFKDGKVSAQKKDLVRAKNNRIVIAS